VRKTAVELGINKVLLNGDILEESDLIDVEVFTGVYNELEKNYDARIETVINTGNHDVHGELDGRVLCALRAFRKIATIVEKPTLVWNRVQVVPWMADPNSIIAEVRNISEPEKKILVLHCGVQGARTGPTNYLLRNPIKLGDVRSSEFAAILLSDYHTSQRLQEDPPVWYLGSPLQHTFGETHKPCIWRILLRGSGGPDLKRIYTYFPRFRRISADSEQELKERTASFRGDYVRVSPRSNGLSDDTIARISEEIGYQVVINRKEEEKEDVQDVQSVNFQSAMCDYVWKNVKSKSRGERLLKLGWRIFNGET